MTKTRSPVVADMKYSTDAFVKLHNWSENCVLVAATVVAAGNWLLSGFFLIDSYWEQGFVHFFPVSCGRKLVHVNRNDGIPKNAATSAPKLFRSINSYVDVISFHKSPTLIYAENVGMQLNGFNLKFLAVKFYREF